MNWQRKSWVDSANEPEGGFPLQSLPYCVFASQDGPARIGVGIGDFILDLARCEQDGLLNGVPAGVRAACGKPTLNALISSDSEEHAALRERLMDLAGEDAGAAVREDVRGGLATRAEATLLKPFESANYTDFYASIHHATRVGRLFRPDNPLLPNYKWVPIGYHGRASSIVVSGTPVRRPSGQTKAGDEAVPRFGPSKKLDYELEVGLVVKGGNQLGEPIRIAEAGAQIFGVCLVNDWSARDIQPWEYQPLGPFLAKSFATSVSPWVVPMEALAPFRVPAAERAQGDPEPLPYLKNEEDQGVGAIDMVLEAWLLTPAMRRAGEQATRLSQANMRDLYWTPAQLVAHHTSNGCNLLPGDLLATGTVSGPADESAGCLLELTTGGKNPVKLPNGESRSFLEDGDELTLRGFCRREGFPRVSLGECRGVVLKAL
ncbi:MAG TPA: fumarylacetoacetase [Terracidiphilus sp.]|nr:fumarylacetoacetase [Terracidiphilus sp.]